MIGIGQVQQAPRALPSVAPPRPMAGAPSTATADFAALVRAASQGSPPANATGSRGQAEWLAQASRRPDIEAALAQFHMVRRAPPSPASRTGRCPTGASANLPELTDCNASGGLMHDGTEEIASTCAQALDVDRCNEQHKDPLARQDERCVHDVVYGVSVCRRPPLGGRSCGLPGLLPHRFSILCKRAERAPGAGSTPPPTSLWMRAVATANMLAADRKRGSRYQGSLAHLAASRAPSLRINDARRE